MGVKERVQEISNNKNVKIGMGPVTAKIELTGRCNFDCLYCNHHDMAQRNERQRIMSADDFDTVINYINGFDTLKEVGLFYMGEAGLVNNLDSYYKKIKDNGYFTYLTTNGSYIKNIVKAIPYIDSLKVSWNYSDPEDFIYKTGKDLNTYYTIKSNINILKKECNKQGKKLCISTILDKDKEEYSDVLSSLNYDEHYFIVYQSQGGTNKHGGKEGVVGESEQPSSPIPCWSLFKGLYIDCDLNVRCCTYGHHDYQILGNIKDPMNIQSKEKYETQQLAGQIPSICTECLKFEKL